MSAPPRRGMTPDCPGGQQTAPLADSGSHEFTDTGTRREASAGNAELPTVGEAVTLASMITSNGVQPEDVVAFALVVMTGDRQMIVSHSPSSHVGDMLRHASELVAGAVSDDSQDCFR